MKKHLHLAILSLTASIIFSAGAVAQEQTDVSILVKKDGKVIQDTTYQFDNAAEAEQAVKMMGVLSGDDEHMEHYSYNYTTTLPDGGESKRMVFISEDGKKTEIREFQGDTLVWVSEEEGEGKDIVTEKHIRVMVSDDEGGTWNIVTHEGDDQDGQNVIILKDEDGNIDIKKIMEEQGEGENVKVIIIQKSGDVDHEMDMDHDTDADHDVEVEVFQKQKE
jgi:hypothetical protein